MFRLVLLQRNGLLVSIQHLLSEMLCRVAGRGGKAFWCSCPRRAGSEMMVFSADANSASSSTASR